jgi:HEPN domain-containing protein
MCHQVIEKILKACYINILSEIPPYTHSLSSLANKCNIYILFSEEQKDFIDILEPMQIEARYPSQKDILFKSLTEEKCIDILQKTKELQQWIKAKL